MLRILFVFAALIGFFVAASEGRIQKYLNPQQKVWLLEQLSRFIEDTHTNKRMAITPAEVDKLIWSGRVIVWLDARPEDQKQLSWIENSKTAQGFAPDSLKNLDKTTYIVYDDIGLDALEKAKDLNNDKRIDDVVRYLRGGLLAWISSGHRLVNANGNTIELKVSSGWLNLAPPGFILSW